MGDKTIGFIGLGEMGKPMAKNLVNAGFSLTVFDLLSQPMEEIGRLGANAARSSREVAEACTVVITMVVDIPETEQVIFGRDGIWEGVKEGSTLIIMSTIDPTYCQELARRVRPKRLHVLDAPVSGRSEGAGAGTLSIFVGGEKEILDECLPILKAIGKNIYHMGGSGMGETTKILNNMLMFINTAGIKEGLALAKKAGIEEERFIEVVKTSSGNSWALQRWDRPRPAGRATHSYKDLRSALDLAVRLGIHVPVAAVTYQTDHSH